jgi:hypothetical protein
MRRFAFALALLSATIADAEEPQAWSFAVSAYGYDVPDSDDFVNPGFTADRGRLHLEARYNYEALDTASVWGGANFSTGEKWLFDSTVMLGAVFGDFDGVAPGFRLSLTRSWFELTSEGEYYFDFHDHEENYLYSWTEIGGYPTEWFRAGVALQRTRAYASDVEVERGVFVGFTYKSFDAAAYVYDPAGDPFYVLGLSYEF